MARRNNVGHWVDVPRFEQEDFGEDQAAVAAGIAFTGPTQPGVPRTGVVYSTSGNGHTAGNSPSYPVADRLNIAGVQGVIMRYRWRELETSSGVYTFDRVAGELAQCLAIGNARGARFGFVIFIEVRAFDNVQPAPPYLQAYTSYRASDGTYDMWRWNATVQTRFAALVNALAAQFDSHVCWEGIAVSETATVGDTDSTSGYTVAGFRDGLIAETNAIAAALTNGRHFFYHNFLSGGNAQLDAVVDAGIANGAMVLAGPDILPGNNSLENNVYPRFVTYNGDLPLMCAAQNDSHRWNSTLEEETPPYDTMQSIFDYGRNVLKVNYLPWTWRRSGAGRRFDEDALVIAGTPAWQPSPGWTNDPAWSYIGAGTAATGNNTTSLVPALPTGWEPGDLLVLQFQNYGGTNARVPTSTWTSLAAFQNGTSRHRAWYTVAVDGQTAPTLTFTGTGANNDTQLARVFAFRPSGPAGSSVTLRRTGVWTTNATADNIGPIGQVVANVGDLLIVSAGKNNDFNGEASATGFTLAATTDSITGNDAGMALLYNLEATDGATGQVTVVDGGATNSTGVGLGFLAAFITNIPYSEQLTTLVATGSAGTLDTLAVEERAPGSFKTVLGLMGTPWVAYLQEGARGVYANGQVGILSVIYDNTQAVSSVQATGSANTATIRAKGAADVPTVLANALVGSITVGQTFNHAESLIGNAGTGSAGDFTLTASGSVIPTGAQGTGALGDIFTGQAFTLGSVSMVSSVGVLLPSGSQSADLVGVGISGYAADLLFADRSMRSKLEITARIGVRQS
jgi:hypothetical protein